MNDLQETIIMQYKDRIPRTLGTHDGTFHADEVTACALLEFFNLIDGDKVYRTRDINQLSTCEYVCDVGGEYNPTEKRFDHHQIEYKGHLSSAGMVLDYLKTSKVISQKDFDFFNNALVRGVDAHDNGKDPQVPGLCSFSHIISNFCPIRYDASSEEQYAAFLEAKAFAYGHLKRLWTRHQYNQSCKDLVIAAMREYKDCLIFDKAIPWMDSFFELEGEKHPALFVIMPSGNYWKLRAIPPTGEERMKVRQPLPEEWAGLLEDELKTKCGIPGALFCHKGRFISVWKTKEDALTALQKVLQE